MKAYDNLKAKHWYDNEGVGMVRFETEQEAERAVNMFNGRPQGKNGIVVEQGKMVEIEEEQAEEIRQPVPRTETAEGKAG